MCGAVRAFRGEGEEVSLVSLTSGGEARGQGARGRAHLCSAAQSMQIKTPKRHEHHLGFALLQSKQRRFSGFKSKRGNRTSLSSSSTCPAATIAPGKKRTKGAEAPLDARVHPPGTSRAR